ncbi:hypothetical protein DQY92_19485 [Salmonella enterica subsp. enterica serovar Javiana]|nr:hypothetical protein [Salmonella enterica subsp. enterica serovar Javiana]EBV2938474.1 hypothetical protein [Salmonella enterica subsp. enterica serovar Javiana]
MRIMSIKLMKVWRFLRAVDAPYHWIGLGSFAVLLVKVLILNSIPAPLDFMSAVSPVVEGILGSVIASYIFYIFCIHPPLYTEKKTSAAFVNFILTRITRSFEEHIKGVSATLSYDSTADDFYQVFTGLSPFTKNAPLLVQFSPQQIYADWFQYFQNENVRLQKEILRLMDSRLTLDAEMTYILNVINDCSWFMVIGHMTNVKGQLSPGHNPFVNPSHPKQSCCESMYELKELIRKLQPIIDKTGKLTE